VARLQDNIDVAERIIAEHGSRAGQHVVDLAQAAIRRGASSVELENLAVAMKLIEARARVALWKSCESRASERR
jgi:SpoU rRNA methylase family enzyme